jgi:hypothetical protein
MASPEKEEDIPREMLPPGVKSPREKLESELDDIF